MLAAQIGHGKLADGVQVLDVAAGGDFAVVGFDALAGDEVTRDVGNVVAVVSRLGPGCVAGLEAFGARLRAGRQGVDLHAGIVVIKLTKHIPALAGVELANRVTQRRLAAVAHVQRAGWVGRDKFDQHFLIWHHRLETVAFAGSQHFAHGLLLGFGLEPEVDEARAGDLNRINPALVDRQCHQRGLQTFGELARIELERLGQLHGRRRGKVAMGSHLGRLESGLGTGTGAELFQLSGQGREQFLFDLVHALILRAAENRVFTDMRTWRFRLPWATSRQAGRSESIDDCLICAPQPLPVF